MRKSNPPLELLAVIEAAWESGVALKRRQSQAKKVGQERVHFSTNADAASDRLIRKILGTRIPGISFYSEELGGKLQEVGLQAVIDGVDGTANFFHGHPFWGNSVAITANGLPLTGAIALPVFGKIYFGHREIKTGCLAELPFSFTTKRERIYEAGKKLKVSRTSKLSESRIACDWTKGDNQIVMNILGQVAYGTILPTIHVCATASMMLVAEGAMDGCILIPTPEDVAAASLIVEKAGGRVTDLNNMPWTTKSKGIMVASNDCIHDSLVLMIQENL